MENKNIIDSESFDKANQKLHQIRTVEMPIEQRLDYVIEFLQQSNEMWKVFTSLINQIRALGQINAERFDVNETFSKSINEKVMMLESNQSALIEQVSNLTKLNGEMIKSMGQVMTATQNLMQLKK